MKVTEVSDGGGPEVSSTVTRDSDRVREVVAAGVVCAGRRAPQLRVAVGTQTKIAPRLSHRVVITVRGEK
jgi:hypothetical protein